MCCRCYYRHYDAPGWNSKGNEMELVSLIFCLRQQTTLDVGDQFKWEICHRRTARTPKMCEGRRLCGIHVKS